MTLFRRSLVLSSLTLAALVSPLAAQNVEPVAVVSIANGEKNLADIVYLTGIVGMEDTGKTAQLFGNALTAGVDKTKPSGLLVLPSGTDFQAVAFIPVTNLKLLLEVHKEQVGEPKDIGGSILEIGTDRKAFVKEQAGWAFVAERKELLNVVPSDPTQLLGDLPSKYNIAGRVFVQNIPAELRKAAIDQMKAGMEAATKAQPMQPGAPDPAQMQALMQVYTQQMERLINETDEVTAGLVVNPAGKSVNLEFSLSAKDGTDLAKRMALQTNLKSSFGGIALPEAAFSAVATAQLTEADLAQAKAMVKVQRLQLTQQIDMIGTNFTPEQKEALKKLMGRYLDLIEQSSSTRQDGGFAVVLAPGSLSAVAGGFVPDDAAVDAVVKEFADFVKANPNPSGATMEFTMNAGTLGDLKLHRGSMVVNQQDFRRQARFRRGQWQEQHLFRGRQGLRKCTQEGHRPLFVASGPAGAAVPDDGFRAADPEVRPVARSGKPADRRHFHGPDFVARTGRRRQAADHGLGRSQERDVPRRGARGHHPYRRRSGQNDERSVQRRPAAVGSAPRAGWRIA
jgi:hypothetical protein